MNIFQSFIWFKFITNLRIVHLIHQTNYEYRCSYKYCNFRAIDAKPRIPSVLSEDEKKRRYIIGRNHVIGGWQVRNGTSFYFLG